MYFKIYANMFNFRNIPVNPYPIRIHKLIEIEKWKDIQVKDSDSSVRSKLK